MNAYVELSNYQVAALLLWLPSQITLDFFAYLDPYAAIAYRKELEQQAEEQHGNEKEFIAQNDVLDRIEEEQEEINENDISKIFKSIISTSASDKEKKKASTKVDYEHQAFGQILMYI